MYHALVLLTSCILAISMVTTCDVFLVYCAGFCVVLVAWVLLQVHGSQDCRNMQEILTTCEAQFHQNMSGNFTADCSSGAVQGYGDCVGKAVMCTNVVDATEKMLNYEYGYTANQEEDAGLEKRQFRVRGRRLRCRFYCYPSKS